MIKEFSTHPKPQNKKARIIFLVTLLISAVVFFVSFYIEKYSGLVGLVALMLLITSILFLLNFIILGNVNILPSMIITCLFNAILLAIHGLFLLEGY